MQVHNAIASAAECYRAPVDAAEAVTQETYVAEERESREGFCGTAWEQKQQMGMHLDVYV